MQATDADQQQCDMCATLLGGQGGYGGSRLYVQHTKIFTNKNSRGLG
jgi:hypothetical protein